MQSQHRLLAIPSLCDTHTDMESPWEHGTGKGLLHTVKFPIQKNDKVKMKQLPQACTTKTWQEGGGTVPAGFGTDTAY